MVTVKFGTNGVQQGESCFVYSKTAKERSDRKRRKTNEKNKQPIQKQTIYRENCLLSPDFP